MNIKKLKLFHYRNYEKASFSFHPKSIHILSGNNAQGKTNLIESIYYLAHLRSFRVSQTEAIKMHGFDDFVIEAYVESHERNEKLRVSMQQKKKQLFRSDKPVKTYSQFVGLCNAILFCPDDMYLFLSGPKEHRKFIDMELIKLNPSYTAALSEYQKLLKLKNAALKHPEPDWALIDVYTRAMIAASMTILKNRKAFVEKLAEQTRKLYPFFSRQEEKVDVQYSTFVQVDDALEQSLIQAYRQAAGKEKFLKTSAIGVHKDDIVFVLNGLPVSQSASQGQKRSFLLALKLALAQIIYEEQHQYPILLLDDVFSELDPFRKRQLLEHLPEEMQVFITTAEPIDLEGFEREVYHYTVDDGTMIEKER